MFYVLLFIILYSLFLPPASAQTPPAAADRYWAILVKSPRKGTTFDRICQSYSEEELLKKCTEAAQVEPQNAKVFLLLGLAQQKTGKKDEAVQSFEKAKQLNPNDALAPFYQGEILVSQDKLTEAAAVLEEAVKRKPQRVDRRAVLSLLAETYQRLKQQKKAAAVWKQLEEFFPDDTEILVQVAETLETDGQHDAALDRYKALLNSLEPDSQLAAAVLNKIKAVFIQKADTNGLTDFYRKRIAANPNDTGTVRELAAVLKEQGKNGEAESVLTEALERHPSDVPLRFVLADVLTAQQEYAAAIEQYQQLDKFLPDNTDVLLQWGKLVLKHSHKDAVEAVRVWRRIADKKSDDAVAQITVADLFVREQLTEQAEEFYLKAVKLRPDDLPYRESLAQYYKIQGKTDNALETLLAFVKEKQRTAEELTALGQILSEMNFTDEAVNVYKDAAARAPNDRTVQQKYAEVLIRYGSVDDASVQIGKTIKQIENDVQFEKFLRDEVQLLRSEQKLSVFVQQLEEDIAKEPDAATFRDYWHLAMQQQAEVRTADAVCSVEKALTFPELPMPLLRCAAEIYVQNGDNSKAAALYQTLINTDAVRKNEYLKQLAALQLKLGKKNEAVQTARQLLTAAANAEQRRSCAEILLSAGERDEGIEILRQALTLEPDNRQTAEQLAALLADAGKENEAIALTWQLLDRADTLPAKFAILYTLAGYYRSAGTQDVLIQKLKQQTASPDKQKESVLLLAAVHDKNADFTAARKLLEQQFERDKNDADVLRQLVTVLEQQHDWTAAAAKQETVFTLQHNAVEEDKLLMLYEKAGQTVKRETLLTNQILQKKNRQEQLDYIDRLFQTEQYAVAERVLTFLEIHEPANWQTAYRQIALASYTDDPELAERVKRFRSGTPDGGTEQPAGKKEPSVQWVLPGSTALLTWNDQFYPDSFCQDIERQRAFVPTLFRDKLRRSTNLLS
ncbi:MAG: tetratricopeptide repeat protein, partial [Planctomycetaceae bacterium]|nr:tetratricopeptide repeat protein [Planctomycetaceae bacterium]